MKESWKRALMITGVCVAGPICILSVPETYHCARDQYYASLNPKVYDGAWIAARMTKTSPEEGEKILRNSFSGYPHSESIVESILTHRSDEDSLESILRCVGDVLQRNKSPAAVRDTAKLFSTYKGWALNYVCGIVDKTNSNDDIRKLAAALGQDNVREVLSSYNEDLDKAERRVQALVDQNEWGKDYDDADSARDKAYSSPNQKSLGVAKKSIIRIVKETGDAVEASRAIGKVAEVMAVYGAGKSLDVILERLGSIPRATERVTEALLLAHEAIADASVVPSTCVTKPLESTVESIADVVLYVNEPEVTKEVIEAVTLFAGEIKEAYERKEEPGLPAADYLKEYDIIKYSLAAMNGIGNAAYHTQNETATMKVAKVARVYKGKEDLGVVMKSIESVVNKTEDEGAVIKTAKVAWAYREEENVENVMNTIRWVAETGDRKAVTRTTEVALAYRRKEELDDFIEEVNEGLKSSYMSEEEAAAVLRVCDKYLQLIGKDTAGC